MWSYTPRRMAGFLHMAAARRRLEAAERLHLHAMAARGHERDVRNLIRQWQR